MRVDTERGFTLIELLMVVAVIGVTAAIALPGLQRAQIAANESSAVSALRSINSAETSYAAATGGGGFATQLAVLAQPCPGSSQGFISPDMSADPTIESGYSVTLAAGAGSIDIVRDCTGHMSQTVFYAWALPVAPGASGHRGFSTATHGVIFFTMDGSRPPENGGDPLR